MDIKITQFGKRHFDKDFGGTKILDLTIDEFERIIQLETSYEFNKHKVIPGYAPFCKLLIMENFTDAKIGSMPITLENYQYLRSGYSARKESELPVFSRWFELPIEKPIASHLIIVLYSKEQIEKEANENKELKVNFNADWGIVAILGQSHGNEEPMKPETMLRNALGIKEGGSGVPLDRDKYLESVSFWSNNATVK